MRYEIIDTPNNPNIKDLITWCPISSSKVLKITHGESQSYISLSSLDSMNKTNKLKNPLTNIDFPNTIKNAILDAIKFDDSKYFLDQLDENLTTIKNRAEMLDLDIDINRAYNLYESFIDYKLKLIDIFNQVDKVIKNKTNGLAEEKILETNNKIAQLKTQLYEIEKKLELNKEHLFYRLELINILCFSRKLDIDIPFLTELDIPDYIITDSKSHKLSKLFISLSNKKDKVGREHGVLIKNLKSVVQLLSYDYLNFTIVWLENVKWNGYIDLTKLHNGMFKFDIYSQDQKFICPNNIGALELNSYCVSYPIDLFYVSYATEIELKGDFEFKSFPRRVSSLVWIIENTSDNTCNQFIRIINERNFKFNRIIVKSENIDKLNEMLRYLNSTFYYTESCVFTMSNFETGAERHMYNVNIYNRIFTPLGDLTGYFGFI